MPGAWQDRAQEAPPAATREQRGPFTVWTLCVAITWVITTSLIVVMLYHLWTNLPTM